MIQSFQNKLKQFFLKRIKPMDLPWVLSINRIYILPNKSGLICLFSLFLMFIASVNGANNLGFLVTFLLVGVFIIAILQTFNNLHLLQINDCQVQAVFAGDKAKYKIRFSSSGKSHRQINFIWKEIFAENLSLNREESKQVTLLYPTSERGLLQPEPLKLFSSFPLGLIDAWSYYRPRVKCLVYPKPLDNPPEFTFMGDNLDSKEEYLSFQKSNPVKSFNQASEDIDYLRKYLPGDRPGLINWKASAKGQGLRSKEFANPLPSSFSFDYDQIPVKDVEYRLSYLTAMILRAEEFGQRYSLKLPGKHFPKGNGAEHQADCLRALALFNSDE